VEEELESTDSADEGAVEGEATTGPLEPTLLVEGWDAVVLALPV
jgi:hypothetical protein